MNIKCDLWGGASCSADPEKETGRRLRLVKRRGSNDPRRFFSRKDPDRWAAGRLGKADDQRVPVAADAAVQQRVARQPHQQARTVRPGDQAGVAALGAQAVEQVVYVVRERVAEVGAAPARAGTPAVQAAAASAARVVGVCAVVRAVTAAVHGRPPRSASAARV